MDTTYKCAHCGGELGPSDGFCALCGRVVSRCAVCEAPLSSGDLSCARCGTPVDPAALPDPFPAAPDTAEALWADLVERLRRATAGEFEIGRELGRGGMAAVFLAHEVALDRPVAIKVMSPGLLLGEGMVDRFRHEAITIAHLHHPNIVSVHSVRHGEGLHFFVMQYVQGRTLEQIIRQAGKLPLPIVRAILHQVGAALAYAHRRRVIHRDIKPANILIDAEGNAVVTDFGIAKAAESPTRTVTGALVGTPAYMSPEQCRGAEVSGASDQYALGAVAYEMLTGSPPFGGSTYTVLQAHVERPPVPLRERLPDCQPEVEAAVLRMLAKDPADRWPAVTDALAQLGAQPLADDDPLRQQLTRLVAGSIAPAPRRTPVARGARDTSTTPVGEVRILPPPVDLEVGDTFVLVALVRGPNGARLPSASVDWRADPDGVLSFDGAGGTATAVGAGTTVVTATCRGAQATLRVDVTAPRADEIVIDPPERGVRAGDQIHLEASPRDKRGRPIARRVTWQTADPATATVTPEGALIAQAPGLARISAVLDGVRTTIAIPVLPARVAALRLGEPPTPVAGDTPMLTAIPVDRWGAPLADRAVLWSSSDVKVAVVTAGGTLHALRPGSVVLTASCEGVSETMRLVVSAPPPAASPAPPAATSHRRMRRRRSRRLVVASLAVGLAGGLAWGFTRPSAGADLAALPEPVAAPADDTAAIEEPGGMIVIGGRPRRALRPGRAIQLTAEVRGRGGLAVPGAEVYWASSDTTILRADSGSGWIRAVRPGQAYVIATGGGMRDSAPIAVRLAGARPPAVASIAIAPLDAIEVGGSLPLRATVLDAAGGELADAVVSWRSSDPGIAVVDSAAGEVRGVSVGQAMLVARVGRDSATADVTVRPPAVADVIVHGARPLVVGDAITLVAIPVDGAGRALDGHEIEWTSSDAAVLTIGPSGVGQARSPGSVIVTATAGGRAGGASIVVSALPDPAHANAAAEPYGVDRGILDGVEACYSALRARDANRISTMYRASRTVDRDNLKRLRRILQTREWSAEVGERVDGARMIGYRTAAVEFTVPLTWTDGDGVSRRSEPLLRAEFTREGDRWAMSSCRIVGTPNL